MELIRTIVLLTSAMALSYAIAAPPQGGKAVLLGTGQTSCWDSGGNEIPCAGTGQDGEFQLGVPRRFVDNGNGTITEVATSLTWEKKSKDGSIHDFRTPYNSWDDAFAIHIATLNAERFGGHNDWRLPNLPELQTLVNIELAFTDLAVFPEFNSPECQAGDGYVTVLTGSCTSFGGYYWSSTTSPARDAAWTVPVNGRGITALSKVTDQSFPFLFVRAVRGGMTIPKK